MPTTSTRKTLSASERALERCIEPTGAEEFFGSYWEQKPLVVSRNAEGRFDDLLSRADAEALVGSGALRHPAFRLVKEGEKLEVRDYTLDIPWRPSAFTGSANVERVASEFERGATIVLQGLHHNWQPLALFCRALETRIGHPVQANAYYTPKSAQGLAVHHDTHDVFVLQVAGEKRWLVYEPVLELPLGDQRYSRELGEPGKPILDVMLRPGDTLYLPRGWLHEGLTSRADSLHLTVGIKVYTWIDALEAAVATLADDVELRRAVPVDGEPRVDLVSRLEARLGGEDVARRMRTRFVRTRRPILADQLAQIRALGELTPDTLVERRGTVIAELEVGERGVTLAFEGKEIVFPLHARDEVEHAAGADEPFRPRDLRGELDDDSRLVLVRRLVREGFLRLTRVRESDVPSRSSDGAGAAQSRYT